MYINFKCSIFSSQNRKGTFMTLKTTSRLLPQETPSQTPEASLLNPGLGGEALEIKKTTDQFAQKEAVEQNSAPATPRPSLAGRAVHLSSSEPEEELLLTPPSKRDKSKNSSLLVSPGSDASVPSSPINAKALFNSLSNPLNALTDFIDDNSPASPASPAAAGALSPDVEQIETPKKQISRFFGGGSTDSSGVSSPVKTPDSSHATPKGTPTPIKDIKGIIQETDLSSNLVSQDKKILAKGLKYLKDLKSPQHSKQVTAVRGSLINKFSEQGPVVEGRSARRDLTVAFSKLAEVTGDWVPLLLEPTQLYAIDRDHLTDFIKGSGMHICPEGHPLDSRIIDRKINRATNIWCGTITTPGKESKLSSFIPRLMKEEEYYSLLNEAFANKEQFIAKGEHKALFMLQPGKNSFCIEVYFREERVVRSAFPIFHYEKYDGKMKTLKIEFENQASNPATLQVYEVSYEDILKKVKGLKKGDLPIEYDTANDQIIDLTLLLAGDPKFPACPIPRGILVQIPKNLI
jgi:hypothetical protein